MPRLLRIAVLALLASPCTWAVAQSTAPGEAYKTSPFHRVINEATGKPIPCRCVFQGRDYRVGETVCMNTYKGILITVCDLHLNNTTWVPTDEPCTTSWADSGTSFGE